ncbi:MAG TPA: DUF3891 family protein [Actinomycetota bacterium]|nr:DUF3891 family protein [Actinomycetota bacterium]
MITRRVGDRLLCFHQLDHARLSGRLAERWGGEVPELRPRAPVLQAIGHHDAGWDDLDRRPVFDAATGAPHTYTTHGLSCSLEVADRSTSRVAERDSYAGWLVGRHFLSFHERSDRPAARRWTDSHQRRLAALLAAARERYEAPDLEPVVLEANVDWLQLLDALSLALCHAWPAWDGRPMAADYAGGKIGYRYRTTGSVDLLVEGRVDPWPFATSRLEDGVPARLLEGRRWSDDATLQRAWDSAPTVRVVIVLSSPGR